VNVITGILGANDENLVAVYPFSVKQIAVLIPSSFQLLNAL
jgi:hypothetical protein